MCNRVVAAVHVPVLGGDGDFDKDLVFDVKAVTVASVVAAAVAPTTWALVAEVVTLAAAVLLPVHPTVPEAVVVPTTTGPVSPTPVHTTAVTVRSSLTFHNEGL